VAAAVVVNSAAVAVAAAAVVVAAAAVVAIAIKRSADSNFYCTEARLQPGLFFY
jgi:hypothetical protein